MDQKANALHARYTLALGWGALASAALMMVLLGVRPDLPAALRVPMFWVKLAFPAALLAGALAGLVRLSRPEPRLERVAVTLAAPVLAMWLLAVVALLGGAPGTRMPLFLGASWAACPFLITLLSAPLFAALLWAMQGLAVARPAVAGGFAGLLAGAGGALVYALHCPEMAPPFLAAWYLLGMLLPAALGALTAPWVLRPPSVIAAG